MKTRITLLAITLCACDLVTVRPPVTGEPPPGAPCMETHVWEDYHLPHDGLSIQVVDNRGDAAKARTPVDYATLNGMNTQLSFSATEGDFVFDIIEDGNEASGWLGLASITLGGGHITSAQVSMNTSLLGDYEDNVLQHVLMQELLHLVGLGHQRNAVPPSAMDDCVGRAGYNEWLACLSDPLGVGPNAHDVEQIIAIYEHVKDAPPSEPPVCVGAVVVHSVPATWDGGHGHE